MGTIELQHIKKAYGDTVIMEDMSFKVENGERLVLLGPSGCGKSTILRMIAGFEEITGGDLKFDGQVVNHLAPADRNVAMVFQNYALYPHMTVKENILYGLKINKVPKKEYKDRYEEVISALNLEKYLERKPAELSGGQRQRVALARATVKDSTTFLLDEPLSNLDAQLRSSARETLADLHARYQQTMVYVTHDQIEAMTFGTRIALLNFGELQQIDTPENIYRRPANIFTAKFIGNPPMNILDSATYKNGQIILGQQSVTLKKNWVDYIHNCHPSTDLTFGIRPEAIRVHKKARKDTFEGIVKNIENAGSYYINRIEIGSDSLAAITRFKTSTIGDVVHVEFINDHLHFFDRTTTQSIGYPANIQEKIDAASKGDSSIEDLISRDDQFQYQENQKKESNY